MSSILSRDVLGRSPYQHSALHLAFYFHGQDTQRCSLLLFDVEKHRQKRGPKKSSNTSRFSQLASYYQTFSQSEEAFNDETSN